MSAVSGVRRVVIAPCPGSGFDTGFEAWRDAARRLVGAGVSPDDVSFVDARDAVSGLLFFGEAEVLPEPSTPVIAPRAFVERAQIVACHRDGSRWQLMYRLLWRLQQERDLLAVEVDEDVAAFRRMEIQVGRDLHKMHAFVRFRRVEEEGSEHFVAWYEPAHRILAMGAPFFAERFAVMRWSILTPDGSARWKPGAKAVVLGPAVSRENAPGDDALEEVWRTYYRSIFNPARVNPVAMRAEMPQRYWRNLPEMTLLPELLTGAGGRVEAMMQQQAKETAATWVPEERSLPVLRAAAAKCRGCSLCEKATQTVFGAGLKSARLVLVGEQPGDEEDRAGLPFVGPAGRLLDELLHEARIDRSLVYVTNAVKHFKFVERGKRRLHESPRMREMTACRPWLEAELETIRPRLTVCLGATAAKSLLGAKFALMKQHGQLLGTEFYGEVLATIHPSAVLRASDEERGKAMRAMLKEDLERARRIVFD
ncbi:UdgX family uracil-DNA binding protein [Silvibacterium sp.]|uniref:UdgX family uracil-DNA binding protein n=1 Tax=Silvibacterium sp. TaxID=1964179 RepID=UPI0039E4CBD8